MGIFSSVFLTIVVGVANGVSVAYATEDSAQVMVERINQRYDDFFRRQVALEEQSRRREREAGEIKLVRKQQAVAHEVARADYVKSRKKTVVDPRLEHEWNEHQQEWKELNQLDRVRYVTKKQVIENMQKRGRRIPGKLEYELED